MTRHLTLVRPDTDLLTAADRDRQRERAAELATAMGWEPLDARYGDRLDYRCTCGALEGQPCLARKRPGRRQATLPYPHETRGA